MVEEIGPAEGMFDVVSREESGDQFLLCALCP